MEINEKLLKNEKLSALMNIFGSEIERLEFLQKSLITGPDGYVDKPLRLVVNNRLTRSKCDFERINLSANDLPDIPEQELLDAFQAEIIECINEIKLLFTKLRYQK